MDCVTVEMLRNCDEPWGLQISGEAPCYIESIQKGSPAADAGLEIGDFLISINGVSVFNSAHDQVVQLISECGRIARFRILPDETRMNLKTEEEPPSEKPPLPKKANQKKTMKGTEKKKTQTKHFDHTDFDAYCRIDDDYKKIKKTSHKSYDMQIHYEKEENSKTDSHNKNVISNEQNNFIVTRENQLQFDEHYEHEGNFVGKNATVAGAFTGDFNVIRHPKEENDIIGVRSRVLAGIQHFSTPTDDVKMNEKDRGKIVLYTTSLGVHRTLAYQCEEAKKILRGFRVKFEDRDIFENSEYKEELYKLLNLSSGDKFPKLPRLYINDVFVGSYEEIQEMSDCGDLRIRLKNFPKYNIRKFCPSCSGTGIVTCPSCKGKCFRKKNRFTTLKCGNCKQQGKIDCNDCL